MNSAKDILVQEIGQLSEEDARQILELLRAKKGIAPEKSEPTREELIGRAARHRGIHAPDLHARPFRKVEPVECPGIPASELLIDDRR